MHLKFSYKIIAGILLIGAIGAMIFFIEFRFEHSSRLPIASSSHRVYQVLSSADAEFYLAPIDCGIEKRIQSEIKEGVFTWSCSAGVGSIILLERLPEMKFAYLIAGNLWFSKGRDTPVFELFVRWDLERVDDSSSIAHLSVSKDMSLIEYFFDRIGRGQSLESVAMTTITALNSRL